MHVANLVRIRATVYHEYSPTQRTKMGPQRRYESYVGFDSSSIMIS